MNTPHFSMRVDKARLDRWKDQCVISGTDVSSTIRVLMDAWCDVQEEEALNGIVDNDTLERIKEEYGITNF